MCSSSSPPVFCCCSPSRRTFDNGAADASKRVRLQVRKLSAGWSYLVSFSTPMSIRATSLDAITRFYIFHCFFWYDVGTIFLKKIVPIVPKSYQQVRFWYDFWYDFVFFVHFRKSFFNFHNILQNFDLEKGPISIVP